VTAMRTEIEIVGIDRGRESLDSISSHDFDLRGLRSGDEIEISLDLVVVPLISQFRSVSDLGSRVQTLVPILRSHDFDQSILVSRLSPIS
jgi:hypothetical protein